MLRPLINDMRLPLARTTCSSLSIAILSLIKIRSIIFFRPPLKFSIFISEDLPVDACAWSDRMLRGANIECRLPTICESANPYRRPSTEENGTLFPVVQTGLIADSLVKLLRLKGLNPSVSISELPLCNSLCVPPSSLVTGLEAMQNKQPAG